jgi:hypothetical protein
MCVNSENDLVISGPPATLKRLRTALAGEDTVIDFARILPPPPRLTPLDADRWRTQHWGTRRALAADATLVDDFQSGTLLYSFTTPDRPPVAFVARLAAAHPELAITLIYERDSRHIGRSYRWSDGRLTAVIDLDKRAARIKHCGARQRTQSAPATQRRRPPGQNACTPAVNSCRSRDRRTGRRVRIAHKPPRRPSQHARRLPPA